MLVPEDSMAYSHNSDACKNRPPPARSFQNPRSATVTSVAISKQGTRLCDLYNMTLQPTCTPLLFSVRKHSHSIFKAITFPMGRQCLFLMSSLRSMFNLRRHILPTRLLYKNIDYCPRSRFIAIIFVVISFQPWRRT